MNGNVEYENKIESKIKNLILKNNKLAGFYSFIGDKSISTIYTYLGYVNGFLNYINKAPNELSVDDFSGYMLFIQKNEKGEKTTSSYRISVYSALKNYGKYLVASNQLNKNPMDFIGRPKAVDSQKTIEKREVGYLSKKEIPKYIASIECGVGSTRSRNRQKEWKERDLAIIMLFLNTGIRCSALMKIDIDSIDFNNNLLTVTDKESKVNTYELTPELLDIIKEWMDKRNKILNGEKADALFVSNRKTRMDQASISRVVKKYASNIKGKNITPHKLRATYGTHLYDVTKDIYFVQECMRHNNPKTTELYIRGDKNHTKKKIWSQGFATISFFTFRNTCLRGMPSGSQRGATVCQSHPSRVRWCHRATRLCHR
jgi:site-specific recombinase XerD